MQTAVIAQRDNRFASAVAAALSSAGYRTLICAGSHPPGGTCTRLELGACPLTDEADVLIYEPGLIGLDREGLIHWLAVESARTHPSVPLLLAWQGEEVPASARAVAEQAPDAQFAVRELTGLVEQVRSLIGPP
jgi:hypothetical protein